MRTVILAAIVAMGVGLIGTGGASAAPGNGGVLSTLNATPIQQAQYYYYRRRYYRRCRRIRVCDYYGRCWYERRCYGDY